MFVFYRFFCGADLVRFAGISPQSSPLYCRRATDGALAICFLKPLAAVTLISAWESKAEGASPRTWGNPCPDPTLDVPNPLPMPAENIRFECGIYT
jgi:hypothetical protein